MHRFNEPTRTCGVGRFVVDIPATMKFAGGYSIRTCRIEEFVWDNLHDQKEVTAAWDARIAKIETITPPKGKDTAIIEIRDFSQEGFLCKSILYNKEPLDPDYGYLTLLVKKGPVGLWIQTDGKLVAKDIIYDVGTEVARAYRAPEKRFDRAAVIDGRDAFYLRYGAVDLPFEYKESVDIVFREHALDDRLKIHIMTWVVHEENKIGLLERAANSLMMKLVGDLKIEKLRSGQRTVAGLPGEELIERFTENGRSTLSFTWMHLGKKDSAHWPRVVVDMESRDGRLEEKLYLWDALLDSMCAAGRQDR